MNKKHNEIISGVNSVQDSLARSGIMTVAYIYFHDDNTSKVLSNLRTDLNQLSYALINEIIPNNPMSSEEKLRKYVNKSRCSCLIFGMVAGTENHPEITYYFESSVSRSKNNVFFILKKIRKGFILSDMKQYLDSLLEQNKDTEYFSILYFHDDNSHTIFGKNEENSKTEIEKIASKIESLKGKKLSKMEINPFENILIGSNTTLILSIEKDGKLITPWFSTVDESLEAVADILTKVRNG